MSIWAAGAVGLVAFGVTWISVPALAPHAERWSLMDHPGGRKIHLRSTPVVGGAAMALGITTGLLLLLGAGRTGVLPTGASADGPFLATVLGGALLLLLVGVKDDRTGLSPATKLTAQMLAALPMVVLHEFTLFADWLPPWAASAAALIWLLAIINAFNLLDGLDGLMGSVGLLCALAFATLAWAGNAQDTLVVLAALAGALGGFLRWNLPTAQTFAGDGGSLVVGYILATASLRVAVQDPTAAPSPAPVTVLALVLILSIPLYDLCSVLWVRVRERRRLFVGDTSHLAHRLVRRGMSHRQALAFISGCTLVTTLAGLLLARVGPAAAPAVVAQCAVVVGLLALIEGRARFTH